MGEEIFEVWITKHALTDGIKKKKARYADNFYERIEIFDLERTGEYYHGEGKDWHKNYEEACKRANEMKKKKIEGLKKSLRSLRLKRGVAPTGGIF